MSTDIERPHIVFATDFSPWAAQAEAYALCLASTWRASLTVVTVLEFQPGMNPEYEVNRLYLDELMKSAKKELAALTERAAARGIAVQTRMATGIPSEEILGAARAEDADVIVMGTKGKTGLAHVLLGSTAERVIRSASCPVLAVRAELSDGTLVDPHPCAGVSVRRILVPVDFSDCSLEALEYAAWLAQRSGASLSLLHVLEPISYGLDFTLSHEPKREEMRARVTQRLAGFVEALAGAKIAADSHVRGGLPADSILDSARTLPADVIVMGTHGRRGLSHLLSGSVTEAVLRQSRCPVMTVRSPKYAAGHRRVIPVSS
ncbi:MAG: universal stress protein [Nitrospira sp.]|nr:universal stress protein [Nitrospira sp.]